MLKDDAAESLVFQAALASSVFFAMGEADIQLGLPILLGFKGELAAGEVLLHCRSSIQLGVGCGATRA